MSDEIDLSTLEDAGVEPSVIQGLRAQADRAAEADKARAKAEKEAATLRAQLQERETQERQANARAAVMGAGLPEVQADLFLKVNPNVEPTAEAIQAFATQYGLTPPKAPEPTPTAPQTFAAPTPVAGQVPENVKTPFKDMLEMLNDPATHEQALQMFREGKVQTSREYDLRR